MADTLICARCGEPIDASREWWARHKRSGRGRLPIATHRRCPRDHFGFVEAHFLGDLFAHIVHERHDRLWWVYVYALRFEDGAIERVKCTSLAVARKAAGLLLAACEVERAAKGRPE